MDNLFQLKSKNDKSNKLLDSDSKGLVRSITSYIGQYEVSRYELETIKADILAQALNYKDQNTTLFKEVKDVKEYCTNLSDKLRLSKISIKNFFLVEYLPTFGFFFLFVIVMVHFMGAYMSGNELTTQVNVTVSYPIFVAIQYFSIVYLLYLERRYSIENKMKRTIGSFANIFIVLTAIQYMSDNPTFTRTLIQLNVFVLIGCLFLLLGLIVHKEIQTK